MTTGQTAEVDRDSVARVASRVSLGEVRLSYVTAILGAESPKDLPSDWALAVQHEMEAHLVLDSEINDDDPVNPESGGFVVSATFRAEFWSNEDEREAAGDEDAVPDVGVFAVFELSYSLSSTDGLTYADLQVFARLNSVFNVWPYWRELVHSTTARMGIVNPLVVPVLTVNALAARE